MLRLPGVLSRMAACGGGFYDVASLCREEQERAPPKHPRRWCRKTDPREKTKARAKHRVARAKECRRPRPRSSTSGSVGSSRPRASAWSSERSEPAGRTAPNRTAPLRPAPSRGGAGATTHAATPRRHWPPRRAAQRTPGGAPPHPRGGGHPRTPEAVVAAIPPHPLLKFYKDRHLLARSIALLGAATALYIILIRCSCAGPIPCVLRGERGVPGGFRGGSALRNVGKQGVPGGFQGGSAGKTTLSTCASSMRAGWVPRTLRRSYASASPPPVLCVGRLKCQPEFAPVCRNPTA